MNETPSSAPSAPRVPSGGAIVVASALILAALAPAPAARAEDDFLPLMRKAESRRQPQERAEYFGRAVSAWTPAHGRLLLSACLFGRGEALYDLGRFSSALGELDQALRDDPRNARAHFLRADVRLRWARDREEDSPRAAAELARAAAEDLAEYAALRPQDQEGLLAWGQAQLLAGRRAPAERLFEKARSLSPSDPGPLLGLALARASARDWEQARRLLDEADALAKGRDPDVLAARADCRLAQGDRDAAASDYERAIRLHERRLEEFSRSNAPAARLSAERAAAGRTYADRALLREASGQEAPALADWDAACRLGHQPACRRARRLRAATAAPSRRRAPPDARPGSSPSKARSGPGDRIYAN